MLCFSQNVAFGALAIQKKKKSQRKQELRCTTAAVIPLLSTNPVIRALTQDVGDPCSVPSPPEGMWTSFSHPRSMAGRRSSFLLSPGDSTPCWTGARALAGPRLQVRATACTGTDETPGLACPKAFALCLGERWMLHGSADHKSCSSTTPRCFRWIPNQVPDVAVNPIRQNLSPPS